MAETIVKKVSYQSDWNETDSTANGYIKNKPNINSKLDKNLGSVNYGKFLSIDSEGNVQADSLPVNTNTIKDNAISANTTWSSNKINTEISNRINTTDGTYIEEINILSGEPDFTGYYTENNIHVNDNDWRTFSKVKVNPNQTYYAFYTNAKSGSAVSGGRISFYREDNSHISGIILIFQDENLNSNFLRPGFCSFRTPSEAQYISYSYHASLSKQYIIPASDFPLKYQPPEKKFLNRNVELTVSNFMPVFKLGKNLFNKYNIINGYSFYYADGKSLLYGLPTEQGVQSFEHQCFCPDYIPCTPNTDYVVNKMCAVAEYDINGNFLFGHPLVSGGTFKTDFDAYYLRVGQVYQADKDSFMLCEGSTLDNIEYEPFKLIPRSDITSNNFKILTVSQDGTKDYETISSAVGDASDNDIILIYPGGYDEEVHAYDKNIHLIGLSKEKCILTHSGMNYTKPPLEIAKGSVKNLTIKATNTGTQEDDHKAYCVHIDNDNEISQSLTFENVSFINEVHQGVGIGLRSDFTLTFDSCDFNTTEKAALYCHDWEDQGNQLRQNQKLIIKNCTFVNDSNTEATIKLQSQQLDTIEPNTTVTFINNRIINKNDSDKLIEMALWYSNNGSARETNLKNGFMQSADWVLSDESTGNNLKLLNILKNEELDNLKEQALSAYATATESGTIVSFSDGANNIPVKALTVNIESDTGVTNTTITRCRKNLVPYPYGRSSVTADGVTFTARPDGSVKVQGTATGDQATYVMLGEVRTKNALIVGQRYKVTTYNGGNSGYGPWDDCWFQVYSADSSSIINPDKGYNEFTWNGVTSGNTCNMAIRVANGKTVDTVVYPMVRLASDNDSNYEPPTANGAYTFDWSSNAGAITSGILNVITGKLISEGTEYDVAPAEIKTLLGNNIIYSNHGNISVEYRINPELRIAGVSSVAGKTGTVTLNSNDVNYSPSIEYNSGTIGYNIKNIEDECVMLQQTVDKLGGDKIPFDFSDLIPSEESIKDSIINLRNQLYGDEVTSSGELLINGYYIKNNGQVIASSNFNIYKFSLTNINYVEITTYGYNSTAAVASSTDYNATTLPGRTFSASDKMIFPATTIGTISEWTEKEIVDEYDYLYVSCYKNNTPSIKFFNGDGIIPAAMRNSNDISALKTNELSAVHSYISLINNSSKWAQFNNDANNLIPNTIYCITYSSGINNLPYTGFNGFINATMAYYGNSTVWMQTATNSTGQRNFTRVLWNGPWTEWQELALANDVTQNKNTIENLYYTNDIWKVFHKVGVVGDSLASGESASNENGTTQYHDLYPFSWVQCMARDSGNIYYNFSKGGLTTKTWMTNTDYGYAQASQADKKCDMYIIGLGQNDAGQSMTIGSPADIDYSDPDANADTFYGNYAKIIQKLKQIAPKAPIFVCSRPTVPETNAYETAIRAMPTLFDNVYLLDMYKHVNAYYPANSIIRRCLRSGHYNAIAYQIMSKHIEEEISNVIKENLDNFLQIEFIDTNWSWTD